MRERDLLYNPLMAPRGRIKNLRDRLTRLSRCRMAGGWHSEGDGRFRLWWKCLFTWCDWANCAPFLRYIGYLF